MGTTRWQIEFPDEQVEELEALMRKIRIDTKKDLINNALTLLDWAVSEIERGHAIGSFAQDDERFREVLLPGLAAARYSSNNAPHSTTAPSEPAPENDAIARRSRRVKAA